MTEEKEVKILISEAEYQKIESIFEWDITLTQKNYYYGNPVSLFADEKESTIRVREKNNKLLLQVKVPISKDHSLHRKQEYEKEIGYIPECIFKNELEQLTNIRFFSDVVQIGVLCTTRKMCLQYNNIEICLDKNEYLGKMDYEIEVEYTAEYPTEIINILKQLNIETSKDVDGKHTRFIKRKKEYYMN